MAVDLNNFLLSLANAVADEADLTLGRELFFLQAKELPTPPAAWAVLRPYGGQPPNMMLPVAAANVQVMAVSLQPELAMGLAQKLFDALHDQDGLPRHHWVIAGKVWADDSLQDDEVDYTVRLVTFLQSATGLDRVDDNGRQMAVFNFNIRFQER